jgi:energy-converting hydrogenase Eha subunit C
MGYTANGLGPMYLKQLAMLTCMLSWPLPLTEAQRVGEEDAAEQSHFSAEQDISPVQRPITVSNDALSVLGKDDLVQSCLKNNEPPDRIAATWFVGSQIHLHNSKESDLIVLAKNPCLSGANIGPFWVFRSTPQGYTLVLSIVAHDLEVLRTKSKGYLDIRMVSATVGTISTVIFRFNGEKYEQFQSKLEPIN